MESFISPKKSEFTIYSISGCPGCVKSKKYLDEQHVPYTEVNCEEYLIEDREGFLAFIAGIAGKEVKKFPMIFDCSKFVGGFNELKEYCNNNINSSFTAGGNF